jgi:hypothetical protein
MVNYKIIFSKSRIYFNTLCMSDNSWLLGGQDYFVIQCTSVSLSLSFSQYVCKYIYMYIYNIYIYIDVYVTVSNYKKHQQITTGYMNCLCTWTRIAQVSAIQSPFCASQIKTNWNVQQWDDIHNVFCILVDVRRSFTLFVHRCFFRPSDANEGRAAESPIQEPAKKLLLYGTQVGQSVHHAGRGQKQHSRSRRVGDGLLLKWGATKRTYYHWIKTGIPMDMRRL